MSDIDYNSLDLSFIQVSFDDGILVIVNKVNARNTFVASLIPELVQALEYADKDDRVRVVIFTADHTAPAYMSDPRPIYPTRGTGMALIQTPSQTTVILESHHSLNFILMHLKTTGMPQARFLWPSFDAGRSPLQPSTATQWVLVRLPCNSLSTSASHGEVRRSPSRLQAARYRFCLIGATSFLLPRLLGYSAATALLLSGQIFLPTHPLLNRLYFTILPKREDVLPAALTFARELASSTSAPSIVATKALLLHAPSSAEDAHIIESYLFKKMITGNRHDLVEGTKSFKERRSAVFTDTVEHMKEWAPWWTSLNEAPRAAKL